MKAVLLASLLAGAIASAAEAQAAPKYYFQLQDVKAGPEVDAALKTYAGEALTADLAGRPEWASATAGECKPNAACIPASAATPAVGPDGKPAARTELAATLKRLNLRGFDVTVRIDKLKQEMKDPRPGGRLKQLAVTVHLSVFGTTIPDAKLAFSGEGEAGTEAEVADRKIAAETTAATKDAIKDAIKQAVDQAVLKLSIAKSTPANESRRKKKK
jgi:hypothetical protein